jgi:hypothetical protein
MHITLTPLGTTLGVLALLLPLGGCSIDVRDADSGKHSDVEIRTRAGHLSVRNDVDVRDTGLTVYPGAWPARHRDDRESANVNIGTAWFGVKVVAAKFESEDSPERVLDFYRNEMGNYGTVTECRGNVDFKGRNGARQPVCKEKPSSSDVQLITGTEERQRIVAVKPLGDGAEFSLVYVETRGNN